MVQIPVYAFTGFLDSGKTKFIQETLEDERFNAGERTLLLVFEEGEEEYDFSTYPHKNVYLETLDQQTVTTKELQALAKKYRAERVVCSRWAICICASRRTGRLPRRSCSPTPPPSWPITPICAIW